MIGFLAMSLGMFMALLDIQIVAASLSEIRAGLGATHDEITWIQTSYLVAEIAIIPISGFLARVFTMRWVFTTSAILFTISSVACALAWDLESMVVFRAIQGITGGAMIPLAFAAGMATGPGRSSVVSTAVLGATATLAPTLGPTVGGWITQTWSWHWLFFLNVVPGILVAVLVPAFVARDQPQLTLLRRFDALSVIAVMACVGSLQFVLEEGSRKDWFDSDLITTLSVLAVVALVIVVWRGLTHTQPVLDLRAFGNRNFTLGCLFSFVCGIGLYGSIYIVPAFLARVRGWDALQIGETVFVTGVFQVLTTPLVAVLARRFDQRLLLAVGLFLYGMALAAMSRVTPDWGAEQFFWPLATRGVGSMFIIIPITNIALGALAPDRVPVASGLYNLMRNLGGAVGIATIGIILQDQERLHTARFMEATADPGARAEVMDRLTQHIGTLIVDPDRAAVAATKILEGAVQREALTMAFSDALVAMAAPFFLSLLLIPFTRKSRAA
ncbi:DHA2 family efflux MFS transporter permease subunit [Nostoc sp. NIES-2111]